MLVLYGIFILLRHCTWTDLKLLRLPGGCGRETVPPRGDNLTCACVHRYLVGTAGDWELLMGFVTWLIHLASSIP